MQNQNINFKNSLKDRCYRFSLDLIRMIDTLPRDRSSSVISNQVLRSGTSIGANLIEAQGSSSRIEFKRYNEISLKSSNETKYWLGLLKDSGKGDEALVSKLITEVEELSSMLASGILKLKGLNKF